jgi:hypothetical protein
MRFFSIQVRLTHKVVCQIKSKLKGLIRGQKVMLDRDLAALHELPTRYSNRRSSHAGRFPDDFMFLLDRNEFMNWRSQFVTSNSDR